MFSMGVFSFFLLLPLFISFHVLYAAFISAYQTWVDEVMFVISLTFIHHIFVVFLPRP